MIEDTFNHDKDIINYTYIWNKLKNIQVTFYSVKGMLYDEIAGFSTIVINGDLSLVK